MPEPLEPHGDRPLAYWVGAALYQLRNERRVHLSEIAALAKVEERTLQRLELGSGPENAREFTINRARGWAMMAYAYVLDVENEREMWRLVFQRAYEMWQAVEPTSLSTLPGLSDLEVREQLQGLGLLRDDI